MAAATFDPIRYKQTTREQWQDAAEAWHRWGPTFEEWLGEATELMLDLTGVGSGTRVLDVAAGAGGQTLAAASRGATVLATDFSEAILEFAAAEARKAGLASIATRAVDAEEMDVEAGAFDAVISRLGIMYFPDKARALAEQRRALRPGGRVGAIVFAEPDRNGFFAVPIGIIRTRAELPPPAPGLPGPFSATGLGDLLVEAGFHDVEVHRDRRPCVSGLPRTAPGSSASRSARYTRCLPASSLASGIRPGPRSRQPCSNTRGRTGSSARASCSSGPRRLRRGTSRGSG
jgi:SAM-dependent methyltransferase